MTKHIDIITQIRSVAKNTMPQGGRILLFGSQARGDANVDSIERGTFYG